MAELSPGGGAYRKGYTRLRPDEGAERQRLAAGKMSHRQWEYISNLAEARFIVDFSKLDKWSASRLINDLLALKHNDPLPAAFVKAWVEIGVLSELENTAPAPAAPATTGPRYLGDLSWLTGHPAK